MKFLIDTIGAVVVSLVAIPATIAYGIFVVPWERAKRDWQNGDYLGAAIYATLGNWVAWVLLAILIL